jgi:hypothetical protein
MKGPIRINKGPVRNFATVDSKIRVYEQRRNGRFDCWRFVARRFAFERASLF